MQSNKDDKAQENIYTLVEDLTTSGERKLDESRLKLLKSLCKKSNENLTLVFRLLMTQLEKEHAEIRLSSFQVIEELFYKSHQLRQLINEEFHHFLELTVEVNDDLKLPPPARAAKHLKSMALAAIENWNNKFGPHYKKIELGYNFLKRVKKVDFAGIRSRTELEIRRQEELESRKKQVEKRALDNVQNEIKLMEKDIQCAIIQANNCFNLILPKIEDEEDIVFVKNDCMNKKTDDCQCSEHTASNDTLLEHPENNSIIGSEHGIFSRSYKISLQLPLSKMSVKESDDNTDVIKSLKDIIHEVRLKFLPRVSKWINILSKSSCSQQHLERLINMKNELKGITEKYNDISFISINAENLSQCDDDDSEDDNFEDVPECNEMDAIKEDQLAYDELCQKSKESFGNSLDSMPGSSKDSGIEIMRKKNLLTSAPVVQYDDDIRHWGEKRKLHISPFTKSDSLHRFWHHSEFDEEFIPKGLEEALRSRAITFTGDFKSVKWKCRTPLPNGKLCTRQDRFKCPFHGKIIARDESGIPSDPADLKKELERKRKLEQRESTQITKEIEMATGISLGSEKEHHRNKKQRLNGKSQKKTKLTNLKVIKNTSRKRLEDKVLNSSAMGRVNDALDSADKRQSLEKFGSNFNYYYDR